MTFEAMSISVLQELALYIFNDLIDIIVIILLLVVLRSLVLFAVWGHLVASLPSMRVIAVNLRLGSI